MCRCARPTREFLTREIFQRFGTSLLDILRRSISASFAIESFHQTEHSHSVRPVRFLQEHSTNYASRRSTFLFTCKKGASADAGPHYQKLYGRVTNVCGNRRGQPKRSAMQEPHPGRNPSLIRFNFPVR